MLRKRRKLIQPHEHCERTCGIISAGESLLPGFIRHAVHMRKRTIRQPADPEITQQAKIGLCPDPNFIIRKQPLAESQDCILFRNTVGVEIRGDAAERYMSRIPQADAARIDDDIQITLDIPVLIDSERGQLCQMYSVFLDPFQVK